MAEYIKYEPPAHTLSEKARRIAFSTGSDARRLEDLAELVWELTKRLERTEQAGHEIAVDQKEPAQQETHLAEHQALREALETLDLNWNDTVSTSRYSHLWRVWGEEQRRIVLHSPCCSKGACQRHRTYLDPK